MKKDKKLSIAQSAKRLECSVSSVRRYIIAGKLRALQYAKHGKIRISESELVRFLSESDYQEPN